MEVMEEYDESVGGIQSECRRITVRGLKQYNGWCNRNTMRVSEVYSEIVKGKLRQC